MAMICMIGLLAMVVLAARTTIANAAESAYDHPIASHYLDYVTPKASVGVNVPLRDINGNQITTASGTPATVTAHTNSAHCPNTACLQIQGIGNPIVTGSGKSLYYVWEWQAFTSAKDVPGLVARSDLSRDPVVGNSTNGNGDGPESVRARYVVTAKTIPWAFGYQGVNGNAYQFSAYGQYDTRTGMLNAALLAWNWTDVSGGGIGRAMIANGDWFYPATSVPPKTFVPKYYDGTNTLGAPIANSWVTARYGAAVTPGSPAVWGWMVTNHSEYGACYDHVTFQAGTAEPGTLCNGG
jgi:hypothetical protein